MCSKQSGSLFRCAVMSLLVMGLLFFTSYGFTNYLSSTRSFVPSIVFDWERNIPIISWTIIPYWSIDIFYALAFFLAKSKLQLRVLVLRLLTAQAVCVFFFLIFPLKYINLRPEMPGNLGYLFNLLTDFDAPYNQAPSLHITLLIILWHFYRQHFKYKTSKILVDVWSVLIVISVLTTWQHHFIDIPTGILAGCFCLWLWNAQGKSIIKNYHIEHLKWALIYSSSAIAIFVLALYLQGWGLWLSWLSAALFFVAMNYAFCGASGFYKQPNGRFPFYANIIFAPYFIIALLNQYFWTCRTGAYNKVTENISIGKLSSSSARNHDCVIDVTAELPVYFELPEYHNIPMLDMVAPEKSQLDQALKVLSQQLQENKQVILCCALGYSRSALVLAVYLLETKQYHHIEEVVIELQRKRKGITFNQGQLDLLAQYL